MTMLSRHRRYMGAMVAGIFALLLLSNLIPDPLGRHTWRTPIMPEWGIVKKVQVGFRNLGEYIHDNFGFRASLPVLRRALRVELSSPDTRPSYWGRGDQLFWGRETSPEQSSGAVIRRDAVERFVEMIGEMKAVLQPKGVQIVVAVPPNGQSVDLEGLPEWTDRLTYPESEYDVMLRGVRALGLTAVDLRKALRDATPYPRFILTDTHWNMRSSVAAFNATVAAAGHPGWELDPAKVLGPPKPLPRSGDLLRTMRMPPPMKETNFPLLVEQRPGHLDPRLPHHNEFGFFRSEVFKYGGKGPRILIVGDSFTAKNWPRMFVNSDVSEVGWMHASRYVVGSCDFDMDNIERFKPDLLIYTRTERFFPCFGDDWPKGLPKPNAQVRAEAKAATAE